MCNYSVYLETVYIVSRETIKTDTGELLKGGFVGMNQSLATECIKLTLMHAVGRPTASPEDQGTGRPVS